MGRHVLLNEKVQTEHEEYDSEANREANHQATRPEFPFPGGDSNRESIQGIACRQQ